MSIIYLQINSWATGRLSVSRDGLTPSGITLLRGTVPVCYSCLCLSYHEASATLLKLASSCNHDGVIASVRTRGYDVAIRIFDFGNGIILCISRGLMPSILQINSWNMDRIAQTTLQHT